MVLRCPECGNEEMVSVSRQGLEPLIVKADLGGPGTVVGYCGTLPTPPNLYYVDVPAPSPGRNSVYINMTQLCHPYLDCPDFKIHQQRLAIIEDGIVRYRHALPQLYNMLIVKKINPKAYFRKMKNIFGDDMPGREFSMPEECRDHYKNMLVTVYRALNFGNFSESALYSFFHELPAALINEGPEAMSDVVDRRLLTADIRNKVYRRLNESVGDLEKLLPAFFLDTLPPEAVEVREKLNILSGTFDTFNELYAANFEVLCKVLPIIMAIYNRVNNGNVDIFKDADGKTLANKTLDDFMALDNGTKVHLMFTLPRLKEALGNVLNTKIRNGYNHVNTVYEPLTQTGTYHYDPARPEKTEEMRLIDLAYGVICQIRAMLMLVWLFMAMDKMKDIKRPEKRS